MGSIDEILQDDLNIDLDGKVRKVRYSLASLAFITRKFGSIGKMQEVFASMKGTGTAALDGMTVEVIDAMVGMVYAGLITHNPDLTEDDVARMIDIRNMQGIFEVCTRAMQAMTSGGKKHDGETGEPGNPTRKAKK